MYVCVYIDACTHIDIQLSKISTMRFIFPKFNVDMKKIEFKI